MVSMVAVTACEHKLTLQLYLAKLDRDFSALGTWMTMKFSLRRADISRNVID
jgi:hypothetical protein